MKRVLKLEPHEVAEMVKTALAQHLTGEITNVEFRVEVTEPDRPGDYRTAQLAEVIVTESILK